MTAKERKRVREALHLSPGEIVVSAWAQPAHGAGWANEPVWVLIRDIGQCLRQECLQPQEQPAILFRAYGLLAAAHAFMLEQLRDAEVKRA